LVQSIREKGTRSLNSAWGKSVVRFASNWLLVSFITVIAIRINSNERETRGCH
jgi:hypothetical protein